MLCLGFFHLSALAQFEDAEYVKEEAGIPDKPGPKFVIKTNPLAIISGEIPLFTSEYRLLGEYIPDYRQSYNAGISLFTMGPILRAALNQDSVFATSGFTSRDFAVLGYRIQAGYRFYPLYMLKWSYLSEFVPPEGFYLYGLVSHSDARFFLRSDPNTQIQFAHTSITLNLGYQLLVEDDITLDFYVGSGYKSNQVLERSAAGSSVITSAFDESTFIYNSNVKINFGIHIGYVF